MRKVVIQKQAECGGSVDLIYTLAKHFFALALIFCMVGCGGAEQAAQPQTGGEIAAVTNPAGDPSVLPPAGTVYRHKIVPDFSITYIGQDEDYPELGNASGISIDGSYYLMFSPDELFIEQVIGDPNLTVITPVRR